MFNRLVRAAIGPATAEFSQLDELPPMAADVLTQGAGARCRPSATRAPSEFARDLAGHFTAGRAELAELMETLFPELQRERTDSARVTAVPRRLTRRGGLTRSGTP